MVVAAKRSADPAIVAPETLAAASPETVAAAASIASPGHCSQHPTIELVTHDQARLQWWAYEDPAVVCPVTSDHDQDGWERCRWCGGPLLAPGTPTWLRSSRRTYCTANHRLLAFRARQAGAR